MAKEHAGQLAYESGRPDGDAAGVCRCTKPLGFWWFYYCHFLNIYFSFFFVFISVLFALAPPFIFRRRQWAERAAEDHLSIRFGGAYQMVPLRGGCLNAFRGIVASKEGWPARGIVQSGVLSSLGTQAAVQGRVGVWMCVASGACGPARQKGVRDTAMVDKRNSKDEGNYGGDAGGGRAGSCSSFMSRYCVHTRACMVIYCF